MESHWLKRFIILNYQRKNRKSVTVSSLVYFIIMKIIVKVLKTQIRIQDVDKDKSDAGVLNFKTTHAWICTKIQ